MAGDVSGRPYLGTGRRSVQLGGEVISVRGGAMRVATGLMLAVFVMVLAPADLAGHSPTEGKREYLNDNHQQYFQWWSGSRGGLSASPAAPAWLQSNVESALLNDWDAPNNTRTPYFTEFVSGGGERSELWWATNPETPDTTECPATLWLACTDYWSNGTSSDRWRSTTFLRTDPSGVLESWWCESTAQVGSTDGCVDTRRVTLHEAGHAVGMSRQSNNHDHNESTGYLGTLMHKDALTKPTTGYNHRQLGGCDRLSLAIDYDVDSYSEPYTGCGDHLGAPATQNGGIDTTVTQSTSTVTICAGSSFSFTGTLKLVTASALGLISGNGLAGRTVTIYRRTAGGSYTSYTTATVGSGEGGGWSKAISYPSEAAFYFQARYAPDSVDNPALDGDSSGAEKYVFWQFC